MGLYPDERPTATLDESLALVWRNIGHILHEAEMALDNIVRVTRNLTDPAFSIANQQARMTTLGNRKIPTTAIAVGTFSSVWLVELK